jgi:hypothetical protein
VTQRKRNCLKQLAHKLTALKQPMSNSKPLFKPSNSYRSLNSK